MSLNPQAQGDAIAALQRVIAALSASDPQTFYASADTFEQVVINLNALSSGITEYARKVFDGDGEGDGWTGEGADACRRIIAQFTGFLDEIAPLVAKWPEHVRGAGEGLQECWYEVDAILAKYATDAAGGTDNPEGRNAEWKAVPRPPDTSSSNAPAAAPAGAPAAPASSPKTIDDMSGEPNYVA
ncbi:hypothetical protein AB0C77_13850 [Streptomyces sp. NPDC048629]|uniref:hypothetical protein n=1 Tax=Streptomyces sp. NPDC048629 TaxID=3154824 RepID=UPI00341BFCFD